MHSTPISEIAAHVAGLAVGVGAYYAAAVFTHDPVIRVSVGVAASVLSNVIIGSIINFLLKDFVALIVVRPISAYLGAKLLEFTTAYLSGAAH